MRIPVRSGQFRRDVRRAESRGKDMSKLRELILLLLTETALPERYRDHPLKGDWKGYRDAHIEADWLLIYRVVADELHLVRTAPMPICSTSDDQTASAGAMASGALEEVGSDEQDLSE